MLLFNFNHQGSPAIHSFDGGESDGQNISKSAFQDVSESHSDSNSCTKTSNEQQLEQLIGNLLKYGVLTACSMVLVGGVLYLVQYGVEPANYHFFQGQPSGLNSPRLVVKGILSGSQNSIIVVGILLLIAIPVVRVALSLFTFVRQGDFTYTVITLLALFGLIYSFIGAYY